MATVDTKAFQYFSRNQWWFFLFILTVGISLRWLALADRPLHHDEALHAYYGYYFSLDPNNNYYKYNPLLHGPVLYHLMRWTYELLPFSKFSTRLPIAVLGSFLLFLPFLFRRFFSPHAVIALTAMLATSTTMIYWSRFLRHDMLVIVWWAMAAYGIFLYKGRFRLCIVCLALTLQFCTKENSYVTAAITLGFFIFEAFYRRYVQRYFLSASPQTILFRRTIRFLYNHPLQIVAAGVMCFTVFIYFFSGGFRYFGEDRVEGVSAAFCFAGSVIKNSFSYWWHQHQIERIAGPFSYTVLLIGWYDFIIFLLFFCHLMAFGIRSRGFFRLGITSILGVSMAIAVICFSYSPEDFQHTWVMRSPIGTFFNVKNGLDVVCFCFLVTYAPLLTLYHLSRNEMGLAFSGYFFLANLFAYCYLGEKVPWLAVYPLLSGSIYFTLYFDRLSCCQSSMTSEKKNLLLQVRSASNGYWLIIITLLLVYNLSTAFLVLGVHGGIDGEIISQTHTTETFDHTVLKIRQQLELESSPDNSELFLVTGKAIWPTSAYLLGNPNYTFVAKDKTDKIFRWIIADTTSEIDGIRQGYIKRQLPWVVSTKIDYNHLGPTEFFRYLFRHRPDTPPKPTQVWIGCRKQDSICTSLPETSDSNINEKKL